VCFLQVPPTMKQITLVTAAALRGAARDETHRVAVGGAPAIGHFGFFRRRFADTLWPHAGEWLRRHAAQA